NSVDYVRLRYLQNPKDFIMSTAHSQAHSRFEVMLKDAIIPELQKYRALAEKWKLVFSHLSQCTSTVDLADPDIEMFLERAAEKSKVNCKNLLLQLHEIATELGGEPLSSSQVETLLQFTHTDPSKRLGFLPWLASQVQHFPNAQDFFVAMEQIHDVTHSLPRSHRNQCYYSMTNLQGYNHGPLTKRAADELHDVALNYPELADTIFSAINQHLRKEVLPVTEKNIKLYADAFGSFAELVPKRSQRVALNALSGLFRPRHPLVNPSFLTSVSNELESNRSRAILLVDYLSSVLSKDFPASDHFNADELLLRVEAIGEISQGLSKKNLIARLNLLHAYEEEAESPLSLDEVKAFNAVLEGFLGDVRDRELKRPVLFLTTLTERLSFRPSVEQFSELGGYILATHHAPDALRILKYTLSSLSKQASFTTEEFQNCHELLERLRDRFSHLKDGSKKFFESFQNDNFVTPADLQQLEIQFDRLKDLGYHPKSCLELFHQLARNHLMKSMSDIVDIISQVAGLFEQQGHTVPLSKLKIQVVEP
ncbi:MAG: hypothetical protein KDD62_11165, partial [Bdellovibrionales bacterium]|nr:hypothetical protein [Bdellovibrionales bacterium]